ncbi:agmatinase family protein [Gilvimarinus sp. F26214L]|uniref:agmatinase family protein n=1 Tax=Gilvimarinus sp. DZF01 TaxID=3461371 RepID=UPI0040453E6D
MARFSKKKVGGSLLTAMFAMTAIPGFAEVEAFAFPPGVAEKLSGLTDDQRSFLRSPEPLRVIPSRQKLIQQLETRTPEQVRQYVTDMMAAVQALGFQEGDMAEIPLNPEATRFNGFKVIAPEILEDRHRDPGPFSVSRYVHPQGGIPTFAGAPVASTPEDLVAGRVDVAIAGVPQSMSSGSRDARNGPQALRAAHGMNGSDVYALVNPGAVLNIVDFGDVPLDRMSVERSLEPIHDRVQAIAETGTVPFLVGGDHSIFYPAVKAVRGARPDRPIAAVHLGAHYNAEAPRAHRLSDRDAVYRLLSEKLVEGADLIQVGLRRSQAGPEAFEWLRKQGVRYHTMAEVQHRGWAQVMERVLKEAKSTRKPLYISMDVSVLDPAHLSAAGRATPGGLTPRELSPLLRRLCAENEIAGFDITDLAPMLDLSLVSAMNANYMMNACLSGMAMRKEGLTRAGYLNPIAIDHGQ